VGACIVAAAAKEVGASWSSLIFEKSDGMREVRAIFFYPR
jgi:hypothetical protein